MTGVAAGAVGPAISAIICTHNRATYLPAAIESVIGQDLPATAFELIVVDNCSTDDTRRVVSRYGARVRLVEEAELGLSHARNAGWRAARGTWVALLDDDAVAKPGWLRALLRAFEEVEPTPGCVGGRVTPIWEAPRPEWLSDRLALNLTMIDWTDTPHPIVDLTREWLAGANLAFPRAVLERTGGFSTRLGRIGSRLLSGEEILLQRRLLAEGHGCWYEPRAEVGHRIPPDRLRPGWFRRRAYSQGLSDALIWHMESVVGRGERRLRIQREIGPLMAGWFAIPGFLRTVDDPQRFEDHCGLLWRLGHLRGLLAPA